MDERGEIFRVGFRKGVRLSESFLTALGISMDDWRPQCLVETQILIGKKRKNRTHPEDVLLNDRALRVIGRYSDQEYRNLILRVAVLEPEDIFGVPLLRPQRAHVVDSVARTKGSLGFLRSVSLCFSIDNFGKIRAEVRTQSGSVYTNFPVTCAETQMKLGHGELPYNEELHPDAVCLGLARPFQPDSYDREYCFVQCTGVLMPIVPKGSMRCSLFDVF